MIQKFPIIEVKQPIGLFYISSIPASILLKVVTNSRRSMGGDGVQRDAIKSRILVHFVEIQTLFFQPQLLLVLIMEWLKSKTDV